MKKYFLFICFSILCLLCLFGKTKNKNQRGKTQTEYIENLFETLVVNNSQFDINIYQDNIAAKSQKACKFPYHEMQLYDGLNIVYKIPLSEKVHINLKEKYTLADFQEKIQIKTPAKTNTNFGTFIVVKNESNSTIQFQNANTFIGFLQEGGIDSEDSKYEFYLSPQKTGVRKCNDFDALEIINEKKETVAYINNIKNFCENHVYSFTYDGSRICQTDIRPIWSVNEPLWKMPLAEGFAPNSIFAGKEKYFLAGANGFQANLACVDFGGKKVWSENYPNALNFVCAAATKSEKILAGGYSEDGAVLALFNSDGALLDEKAMEAKSVWGMQGGGENLFFISGFLQHSEGGGVFCQIVKIEKNKINLGKKIQIDIPQEKVGWSTSLCAQNENCILAVNLSDSFGGESTGLYKIDFENLKYEEIELNQKIDFITGICQAEKNQFFVCGEKLTSNGTAAAVLKIESSAASDFYIASEINSYFNAISYSADLQEIVCVGTVNAADPSGAEGTPVIRGISLQTGRAAWENKFEGGFCVCDLLCPSPDYGYVISNCVYSQNGKEKSELLRVNSAGLVYENCKTIKFGGM